MTNSDRLQEIRERVEKATPGPWIVEGGWTQCPAIESADQMMRIYDEGGHSYDDALFIAASREDVPWLLQLVTKQENEIAWLRTWIFRLDSNFESAAKKIMASNTEEPMTIEQVKEFLGIDPGSAFGTPGTAD